MANRNIKQDTFPVVGMSCAACSARVEKTLNRQAGVCRASVNLASAMATVEYDPAVASPESLQQAVQAAGFDLLITTRESALRQAEEEQRSHYESLKFRTTRAIILALPVAIIGMFLPHMPYADYLMWALSTPVVFWLGRDFFINAWKQLKHGSANMDTLVANSTAIAYLFSLANMLFPDFWLSHGITPHVYFEAAAVIIAFILLGRLLESRAKDNTSTAIKKLMGLQPEKVTLVEGDKTKEIPIADVCPGDLLLVKPGERIAVDGTVMQGSSYVDESTLSGEPVAIGKRQGDKVFAGTINQKGSFRFRAEKVGSDTLLARIIHLVQEAQGSKAPVQQLVDRIAAVFVPAIIGIAVVTGIAWLLLDAEHGFTYGLLAMTTVLIIACPCALGLATPTAIMVGIGKGAENGILIKDAESLETARRVDAVVLDKTGTVTEGHPVVTQLVWETSPAETLHPHTAEAHTLVDILYSLESLSEHPLAESIVKHLADAGSVPITHFQSLTGEGVQGDFNGETYYAGNLRLLETHGISLTDRLKGQADLLTAEAQTLIYFADRFRVLAFAAIADRIKPTSAEAVGRLMRQGIDVHLLTGDNEATARAIARQAGIPHYRAGVLPADKSAYIRHLQASGKTVAMVGDGINDSAALAQADLSIAMGTGSDIAMDVAKMTLISADLTKIPDALRLSRLTVRTIRRNLFWAFFYNVIAIPIAAGVLYPINGFLLNPMIAGAAMAFSSVSVVANSLRLKRKRLH